MIKRLPYPLLLFCFSTSLAYAHGGAGLSAGFTDGFMHPLSGLDHIAAMVAVGLWGAFLGRPAIWLLPVVFPLVMVVGGIFGMLHIPLPAIETGIASSAIVLGLMVALAAQPPLWLAAIIVGVFAIFHGYAHGAELPNATDPIAYSMGFVTATGLLHLSGVAFGLLTEWPKGKIAVRASGAIIALAGIGFLTGLI